MLTPKEEKLLHQDNCKLKESLLASKLEILPVGMSIKFLRFNTFCGYPTDGHSMLIRKLDPHNYLFMDPGNWSPIVIFNNVNELVSHFLSITDWDKYPKLAFIDNNAFMKRVKDNLTDLIGSVPNDKHDDIIAPKS